MQQAAGLEAGLSGNQLPDLGSLLLPLYGGGFWVAYAQLVAFYYACGFLLHFVVPRLFSVKGIQTQPRKGGEVLRDALYSSGPLAVKAGVWVIVEHIHKHGLGLTYEGSVTTTGAIIYMALCVGILDYLHDAWFYWTHRLLHWAPLYRHVHYIHHKSRAPSAFTGYSFHVVEAAIVFANEILVTLLFPLHMGLHRWYHLLTTIIHEAGHAGYEMAPFIPTLAGTLSLGLKGLATNPALNTVQHHDMHHRFPNKHFSLYFTHWDRLCNTLHPRYDAEVFSYFDSSSADKTDSAKGTAMDPTAAAAIGSGEVQPGTGGNAPAVNDRDAGMGATAPAASSGSGEASTQADTQAAVVAAGVASSPGTFDSETSAPIAARTRAQMRRLARTQV